MGDNSSASYIHLVHRLIEDCILFNTSKEECRELFPNMQISNPLLPPPELEKENKEFFEAYTRSRTERASSEAETRQRIRNMVSGSSK